MRSLTLAFALSLAAGCAQGPAPQSPAGFVDARAMIPGLVVEMRYAGKENFVGRPIDGYEAPVCLLTRQAAAALTQVQQIGRASCRERVFSSV